MGNYSQFDGLLFNTFYTREKMLERFPIKPSITIPWGIEPSTQKHTIRPGENDVIRFVHVAGWGGINNRKNTDLLIEAFDVAEVGDSELHVYTQSALEKYGEKVQRIVENNDRILVFEGTIDDISDVYKDKDMLLWPSKREGVGLPILEALVKGLPVLISDGYMMRQWIHEDVHGLVVPAVPMTGQMLLPEMKIDRIELAVQISRIANDRTLLRKLAANVRRDRQIWEWNWQKELLKNLFLKFGVNPMDPCFFSDMYLPTQFLKFEQERKKQIQTAKTSIGSDNDSSSIAVIK